MTRPLGSVLVLLSLTACAQARIDDSCEQQLACQELVTATCAGAETPVSLPDPGRCFGQDLRDDAPAAFPVGNTQVTFTSTFDGDEETCSTVVRVVDPDPPEILCPEAEALVVEQVGLTIPAPELAEATDACSPEPTITVSPSVLTEPTTDVTYTATDEAGNTATCVTTVQVIELPPASGLRILSAILAEEDRTELTLGWEPSEGRDVQGYQIERAADSSGPFQVIATVGADAQIATETQVPTEGAWYRVTPTSGEHTGAPSAPVRAYAIAGDVYHEQGIEVPSVPFETDLYGVVRAPAQLDGGPFPLVLLLHGNHGNCRFIGTTNDTCVELQGHECEGFEGLETAPNAEGMLYQAETLAAHGVIAVTLSANALNCRQVPDGWIGQRSEYLIENLRRWKSWHDGEEGPLGTTFAGAVDLSRVGLVGHSRGGDAVANVSSRLAADPIEGVELRALFTIGPTDILGASQIEADMVTLLPACDGDVSTLVGASIHDRNLDDGFARIQYLQVGANHNFFNTEWTGNDGLRVCAPGIIASAETHTASLEAILGSYFSSSFSGTGLEHFLRADAPPPSAIEAWADAPLDLRVSYTAPEFLLIDRFDAEDSPGVNLLGGDNHFDEFTVAFSCFGRGSIDLGRCGPVYLHREKHGLHIRWDQGEAALARFDLHELDATGHGVLSFRVVSRWSTWNNDRVDQEFVIRVRDAAGESASLFVSEVQPIPHLYPTGNVHEVLQSVRIPLASLIEINGELDLERLASLEFDFSVQERRGSVILSDIELAD
ncbi:MAG: hypothetical protein EA397_05680 [Deltaproteobacteria bacterium]|nr:MAG: hypothetical protein EA397_05680 [Deltaproteobacteria bacterium]